MLARIGASSFAEVANIRTLHVAWPHLRGGGSAIFGRGCMAGPPASPDADTPPGKLRSEALADSAVREDVSRPGRKLRAPNALSDIGRAAKVAIGRMASVSRPEMRRYFRTTP